MALILLKKRILLLKIRSNTLRGNILLGKYIENSQLILLKTKIIRKFKNLVSN